jgi:hypothetical protein
MALVLPMLSPHGSIDLRQGSNTLELRDTREALEQLLPVLYSFDHPKRDLFVEIWLLRAHDEGADSELGGAPLQLSNVPPELVRSLVGHFRYERYELLSQSRVRAREGQHVTFQLGGQHAVRFRVGTVLGEQRLKLNAFEVLQQRAARQPPVSLTRSNLNLWLNRNMVLALAAGESSPTALMVVVRCRPLAAGLP